MLANGFQREEAIGALTALRRAALTPPDQAAVLVSARSSSGTNDQKPEELDVLGGDTDTLRGTAFGLREGDIWTAVDGSAVEAQEARAVPAPNEGGTPWQLFKATSHKGQGSLSSVTWIQRMVTPWQCQVTYVFFGPK